MQDFTLDDLIVFTFNENKMIEEIKLQNEQHQLKPNASSVKFLLDYSKALRIQKSNTLKSFTWVLN